MANDLELSKSFAEKMRERVRDGMGELLTDEDIQKVIERGVHEALFQKRDTGGQYGSSYKEALMSVWAHEYLKKRMQVEVDKWLRANDAKVAEIIERVIREGAGQAMIAAFSGLVSPTFNHFSHDLKQRFSQIGIDLPDISEPY